MSASVLHGPVRGQGSTVARFPRSEWDSRGLAGATKGSLLAPALHDASSEVASRGGGPFDTPLDGFCVSCRGEILDRRSSSPANPARWTRRSRCWVTAFQLCTSAGRLDCSKLPGGANTRVFRAPVPFRRLAVPWFAGRWTWPRVPECPIARPGPGLPYSHLKIWFNEPVTGPVVIGAGRQRGLGLCVEADEREGAV